MSRPVHVRTQGGLVTSIREAWKDEKRNNRTVWTWRTDGEEPYDFGTVEAAEQWIEEVYYLESAKVRQKENWTVEVPNGKE